MRLLVITQKVTIHDSNLGFFHTWLQKMAEQVDHLYVLCLEKGEYALPGNVTVLSLGKENNVSRWQYLKRFYQYIFQHRQNYDHVFVHMNPEYVVLGGWLWRLWHKKILLWYTHKSVTVKLRVATLLATKIFTASKESFRLKSAKVEVVGHGIEIFDSQTREVLPLPLRLVTVGRVTPSKNLELLIRAVHEYKKRNQASGVQLHIFGIPITESDKKYQAVLKESIIEFNLEPTIQWCGAVSHQALAEKLSQHHVFLHASQTGSVDKAVLEAMASGLPVISTSEAFAGLPGIITVPFHDPKKMAESVEKISMSGIIPRNEVGLEYVRTNHNLNNLIEKIVAYFRVK